MAKPLHDFQVKLGQLHQSYIRRIHRFRRQLELAKTRGQIHHSGNSTFTPIRSQKQFNPRVLFEQSGQHKNAMKRLLDLN